MKKILALVLGSLLVAAAFTACGGDEKTPAVTDTDVPEVVTDEVTFESVLASCGEATKNLDNLAMDITMDIDMVVEGETMDMDVVMSSQVDGKEMFMTMNINMLGQEIVTDTYVDLENYYMYAGVEDVWYKTPMDEATKAQYEKNNGAQIDLTSYSKYMSNGTIKEMEFDGISCYEISGAVDYDMGEMMKEMGLDSMLGTSGLDASMFENAEPFVLVMYVEKETYLPVYCYMDMTEFMNSVMSAALKQTYEDAGMEDVTVEISNCTADAFYYDIGNVTVDIPEEVLAAEEIAM